jgi:hypothetical protein
MSRSTENFYSFSLSYKNKNLEPTQFSKADRFYVHFGNFEKGFREISEVIFPSKLNLSKKRQTFIDKILREYEKKRQLKNEANRLRRSKKKKLTKPQQKKHDNQIAKLIDSEEKYYTYSLIGKSQKAISPSNFRSATHYNLYFGNEKEGYNLVFKRKFPPKRTTAATKKDYLVKLIKRSQEQRTKQYDYYTEKFFSHTDQIKVIDYEIRDNKLFVSVLKELRGLGSSSNLTVRQEYSFYLEPKDMNPLDKVEYEENKKLITKDSLPLAEKLMKIKNKNRDYIFRVLLTMKNAEGDKTSQGFSAEREIDVTNLERFEKIFNETADYFTTKEGSKYLSLYNSFELNGYMLERIVARM